jgi:hypothetical protein
MEARSYPNPATRYPDPAVFCLEPTTASPDLVAFCLDLDLLGRCRPARPPLPESGIGQPSTDLASPCIDMAKIARVWV